MEHGFCGCNGYTQIFKYHDKIDVNPMISSFFHVILLFGVWV